jgi:hypothetical protein
MEEQKRSPTYNGIVFSIKKRINSGMCYNMEEIWEHFAH